MSKAGRRVVGIPDAIILVLRAHLTVFVKEELRRARRPWPEAVRYGGATSTRCLPGRTRSSRSARRVCTSAISAKPETSSRLRAVRAAGPDGPHRATTAGRDYQQYEARGADRLITNAIDAHLQGEQRKDDEDEDGPAGALIPAG